MVLKMARPSRHPITGIFQLRKRVPEHLVPLVGKREEKISLRTRDPSEAKILHAKELAAIEARWRQLSIGAISLSQKQAVAMSGEIYRTIVRELEDDPGSPEQRRASLLIDHAFLRPSDVKVLQLSKNDEVFDSAMATLKYRRNDKAINRYLDSNGYRVDEPSMQLLRNAVATAVMQAKEHILKLSKGDYRPDPDADRFPSLNFAPKNNELEDSEKYQLLRVFDDFVAEKQQAAGTRKKWRGILEKVAIQVPDIRYLTADWVVAWKDSLLNKGLKPVSVRDGQLACLRATCTWAKSNRRIQSNPLDGITVAVPHQTTTRQKWFTAEEVTTILQASLATAPARCTTEMKNAYRWIPWLCAYTGARVGEIAQLRKEDVQEHDGHPLIWITPDAGTTKNRNPRFVAIHPHLVEQGFLEIVRSRKPGPLFYNPSRRRGGTQGNPQYSKVGERLAKWVREIGVNDTRIMPNHAWRHHFKTEARGVFMDVGARDYMQGHVPATEGEAYGGFKPHVLAHEIAKLPKFELR